MKPSAAAILNYLIRNAGRWVSVPELIRETGQSDARKRISELVAEGQPIGKMREGSFVNYRVEVAS